MNTLTRGLILAAALTPFAAAQAQSEKPPTGTGDPSAASTPHQRSSTGAKTSEVPAGGSPEATGASSPHQHAATKEGTGSTKDGVTDEKMWKTHEEGAKPASFVKKAAVAGMTEVELSKVALEKSQNAKVRAFAERMVADHTKANSELTTLAKSKSLQMPTSLDAEHKSMVQKMSSKSGAAFDAAYGEHMNMDHANALALFEGASKSSDADLAAFAKKTLPTLKQHKEMAADLPGTRTASGESSSKK